MNIGRLKLLSVLILFTVMFGGSTSRAAETMVSFDTSQQAELYQLLLREYRCLKCQNQNLADSNAGLAGDLRREIRTQVIAGKTQAEIDEYLVSRYGEFVLYRPRFSGKTLVLWLLPFGLFFAAVGGLLISSRKRKRLDAASATASESPDPDQLEAARRFLENP